MKSGLEIVSLDFVRPVFQRLGLRVQREETLRGVARDVLAGRYPEAPAPEFSIDQAQLAPFVSMLETMVGPKDAHSFEFWVRYVVDQETCNPWTLYENLFEVWASTFRTLGRDGIGLSADIKIIEAKFTSITNARDETIALERQRRMILSNWDIALCSEYGLREIPDSSDYFPFVDAVILTIAMAKFQEFWRWLVPFCGTDGMLAIGSAAKIWSEKQSVQYCPTEELPKMPH